MCITRIVGTNLLFWMGYIRSTHFGDHHRVIFRSARDAIKKAPPNASATRS
ncbi:hypothetical protein FORC37_0963 [Vibrio vulnificus]|nr:hypothetical protein FORC37_0963 [Vibrio vulnificus]